MNPVERFFDKVEITDGCWFWTGARQSSGYGCFGRSLAHRWSYEQFVGDIPDGLTIDHLCRNKLCVNPDHLEPVTIAENNRRAYVLKTHCKRGHLFDEANTRRRGNRRECIACATAYQAEWNERRRTAA